jgi:hypothetical protein
MHQHKVKQGIATLFKLFVSAIYRAIPKREKANDDLRLSEHDSLERHTLNKALSPTGEQTLMVWIQSHQGNHDCSSAREVRD